MMIRKFSRTFIKLRPSFKTNVRFFNTKVPVNLVKELRHMTNSPLGKCREALEESGNDLEQAKEWLRKHGIKSANLKSSRGASQGLVSFSIEGDRGCVVEVRMIALSF